jgi:hypothetical protein
MRSPIPYLLFFILSSLFFISCENEEEKKEVVTPPASTNPTVNVSFSSKYNDAALEIGTVYFDAQGHRIRIENFQSYLSNIALVNDLGQEVVIKDIALANLGTGYSFSAQVAPGTYNQIKIGIGVPEAINKDIDPSTYPNSSPLSIQGGAGMFWTWNTGYIFSKFEGRGDLTGQEGAALLSPFSYHTGDDFLYRTVTLDKSFTIEATQNQNLAIIIQADQIINGGPNPLDIEVDDVTHTAGNPELATKVVENFVSAFSIQ